MSKPPSCLRTRLPGYPYALRRIAESGSQGSSIERPGGLSQKVAVDKIHRFQGFNHQHQL